MDAQGKAGLWRGPITDRDLAVRITKVTAWVFGGIAVVLLAPMISDMMKADRPTVVGDFAVIALLALPSGILLTRQSRGAAAILFASAVVFLIASVAFVAFGAAHYGGSALLVLPLSLAWAGICWLSWRALQAALMLHREGLAAD